MICRHCAAPLARTFVDLGTAPPSNAYLAPERLAEPEVWYPLRVLVCDACRLVQTQDVAAREAFFAPDYAYFSGVSQFWVAHCDAHAEACIARFGLGADSFVVEVASNDGTLLKGFSRRGVPVLGVEPTASTAAAARAAGVPTLEAFFGGGLGAMLAAERGPADLICANNVLAHVPDPNDFVAGFAALLAPHGVATFEFPSLVNLVAERQFDTIYHEHFSYLSLLSAERILVANGLALFDVAHLPTHGGSLRLYARRTDGVAREESPRLAQARAAERAAGVDADAFYDGFQAQAEAVKDAFLAYLIEAKRAGRRVVGYGAAAKGNTLLNFAGVRADLLPFVVDRAAAKQGKHLPGSRIPVRAPDALLAMRPDDVVILPWNIRDEIAAQLREAGLVDARFVTAVPTLEIA